MPIDTGIVNRLNTNFGQQLGQVFDPAFQEEKRAARRNIQIGQQEQEMKLKQLQQAEQEKELGMQLWKQANEEAAATGKSPIELYHQKRAAVSPEFAIAAQKYQQDQAPEKIAFDETTGQAVLRDKSGKLVLQQVEGWTTPVKPEQKTEIERLLIASGIPLDSPEGKRALANAVLKATETPQQIRPRAPETPVQVVGPNGQPIYVPASQAYGKVPASSLPKADKPLTEFQGKSALFGSRAAAASDIIGGISPEMAGGAKTLQYWQSVPIAGRVANMMSGSQEQKLAQAQRDFVNAVLRLESGAVIGQDEFENATQQYFPQPGDSEEVIAQKAQNRERAIAGLGKLAGTEGQDYINTQREIAKPKQPAGRDAEAIAWARANPNDPRAAKILSLHGM